jgi:hypothetical protein
VRVVSRRALSRGSIAALVVAVGLAAAVGITMYQQAAADKDPVLLAAGDIAMCTNPGREQTAALLDQHEGLILALGDLAYKNGSAEDFANCYDPTWGRHKARTRPVPGNHEYDTPGAAGYFGYFGPAAADPKKGWYSFDLGAWHIVALNSNCGAVGGCAPGSPQVEWLRADLAARPSRCTLAYWHHPRFSSGFHGTNPITHGLWQTLYDAGADVILTAHDHHYERMRQLDPFGAPDPTWGIRQFIVGTGGGDLYRLGELRPTSELRQPNVFGVLKLTLRSDSYEWQFLPVAGQTFTDGGSATCHGRRS